MIMPDPHDLMRYFLNTEHFQRGINYSKSQKSLEIEARVNQFVAGQVGEQERESHKDQVHSPDLFSAVAEAGEVAIQQLPKPAALTLCQLQETRGNC